MQAYYIYDEEQGFPIGKGRTISVLMAGCNYRCPTCNVPSATEFREEFVKDLKILKKGIKEASPYIDEVKFTGGEPLLQRQALIELMALCKKKDLKTILDTNGSKPGALKELIERKLVDTVVLDIKAPQEETLFEKTTRSKTFFLITKQIIDDLKESITILRNNQEEIEIEIKTLIIPGLIYRKEDILKIAEMIDDIRCRWELKAFKSSGNLLSKKFSNINSPTTKFLMQLREEVLKEYPNMRIDVEDSDY